MDDLKLHTPYYSFIE